MVKAVFLDFYGTIVHEDGEVIKKVSQEIFDTGKVKDYGLTVAAERFRKVFTRSVICWKFFVPASFSRDDRSHAF